MHVSLLMTFFDSFNLYDPAIFSLGWEVREGKMFALLFWLICQKYGSCDATHTKSEHTMWREENEAHMDVLTAFTMTPTVNDCL